ncbi:MAG: IS110 family transposase [Gaiellaceae bacterium]
MDVHREFAEVAIIEDGRVRAGGRVETTPEALRLFARSLAKTDEVAIEATVNAFAIARLLDEYVARVVISNPLRTRAIAEAKVKTDKVDACVLAELLAAGYLPGIWRPDEDLQALRRLVARRSGIVRERTRLKNQVQAILHRNLLPRCPAADLFGKKGRAWLAERPLPVDEEIAVASALRRLDVAGEELALVERELAQVGLASEDTKRLLTIPGVDRTVALSLVAAIGDISRFADSRRLVSYLGLDPRVRQSGNQPARHGRISKQGRAQARGMLVEAAWACAKTPGPLRAFFLRVRARRGEQVAAVATARKLAVLCWHLLTSGEDYAYARPSLVAQKLRALELAAGARSRRGQRGSSCAYNLKEVRARERALSEQAELAYTKLTERWQKRGPQTGAGAATGERL